MRFISIIIIIITSVPPLIISPLEVGDYRHHVLSLSGQRSWGKCPLSLTLEEFFNLVF